MRALLLTFGLSCFLGSSGAFCDYQVADAGPTISGGEGDSASPRDMNIELCRALHNGTASRQEPVMGGGDLRSPTDTSGLSDTCPGAQTL